MKSIIALVFIATFSLATPSAAIDEKGDWTSLGARSCGEWLEYKQNGGWPRTALHSWLVGFISGANRYRPGKADYLESTDVKSAMLWIDKYCTESPLKDAAKAADALIQELAGRP